MTAYYTLLCHICEHPIKRGDVSAAHWHHEDVSVCRANIRADEREQKMAAADVAFLDAVQAQERVAEMERRYDEVTLSLAAAERLAETLRTELAGRTAEVEALRASLDREPGCGCWTCNVEERWMRMFICPECGNKRCPRATDHRNPCTSSNDVGQPGSRYGGLPT